MATPQPTPEGRWRARVMIDGKRHSKTFDLKRDARAWIREAHVDAQRGEFVPPDAERTTVSQRLDDWIAIREGDPNFKDSSLKVYRSWVDNHIRPHLGNLKMGELNISTVKRWRNHVTDTAGPSTCREAMKVLSAFCSDMVEEEALKSNPCKPVSPPAHKTPEMTFLQPFELDHVVEAISDEWAKDTVLGLAFLGCRINDLGDLTRDRVDEVGERILVTDRKTGNDRWLPIFDAVSDVIDRRLAAGTEFLFTKPEWARLHPANFRREVWHPAVAKAGIGRHVRIHDLRHTCASWLIKQGFTPTQVAAYLGHSSPLQTMQTYAHFFADDMADMGEALDEMWRRRHNGKVSPIRKAE